jgi:hypothetical protein
VRAQGKALGDAVVRAGLGGTYMAPRHGWRMGASLGRAWRGGRVAPGPCALPARMGARHSALKRAIGAAP